MLFVEQTQSLRLGMPTCLLFVVLPEGFEALYSAAEGGEHENHHRRALLMPEDGFQAPDQYELEHQHVHDQEGVPSSYAGLALLAGFLAMMVFEVWHHSYEHACAAGAPQVRNQLFECKVRFVFWECRMQVPGSDCDCALCRCSWVVNLCVFFLQGHGGHRHSHGAAGPGSREMPVLLGLIVHAAADGLAVGVASVSPSIKLAVGVGMAMVLHKGPVAFGLGTFLVSQKLPTYTVIKVRFCNDHAGHVCLCESRWLPGTMF